MCSNPGLAMAWCWGQQADFAFLYLPRFEAVSRGIPTAIWLFREEGGCCVLPQSRDLVRIHGSPNRAEQINEFCTVLDPTLVTYSKTSRSTSRYLWDPSAYFDSVSVWICACCFFFFLKVQWINSGLCSCTVVCFCVVRGLAMVSGDVLPKYSYYLSSLYKLHQISTRHFQKLLLIGQLRLQS